MSFWTEREKAELIELHKKGRSREQAARALHRSKDSIDKVARRLGISFKSESFWTDENKQTVRELWPTHSASKIAAKLGTSRNAVMGMAWRMKLSKRAKGKKPITKSARKYALPQVWPAATNKPEARLADKIASSIEKRKANSSRLSANAGAARELIPDAAPAPIQPSKPLPWHEADGCQWPLDMANVETGQHPNMIVCNEPRKLGRRYCAHHWAYQFTRPAPFGGSDGEPSTPSGPARVAQKCEGAATSLQVGQPEKARHFDTQGPQAVTNSLEAAE